MTINLKNYLLYSSVFAIFTESFFFNYIIDWKLFYLIVLSNYLILLKINKKITTNTFFVLIIGFLFIHGVLTYSIIGIPPNFMFSQILGIMVVGTYYYNFVRSFEFKEILHVYLKMVFWVALIGYPLYFLNINLNDDRLQSIFKEPAHYVVVVLPACFYFLKNNNYKSFFMVFGTLILSNSSLGYLGCAFIFLLPNLTLRRVKYLFISIPFLTFAFVSIYNNFDFLRMRVDDTIENLKVLKTGKFKQETNLSSYVILANAYIMKKNFIDHPFGSGIGSHHYMHTNRYILEVRPPDYIRTIDRYRDNSFDANSLFNRMCSEMGIFGFLFILCILIKLSFVYKTNLYLSQGIFIYILLKLFRDGHYFTPEMYFFIWIMYVEIRNFKTKAINNEL